MKKYIKDTNLVPIDNKIRIYSSVNNIPNTLNNEIVIVEGDGIYKCNNSTKTKIYNDGRNTSSGNVGEIRMFYGNTIPTGWLECTGQQFDTNLYPALYSFLGTNKVPDYREMALRGGTPVGTFSNDAMGTHSHTFSGGCHNHAFSTPAHCHTYCTTYTRCMKCAFQCTSCDCAYCIPYIDGDSNTSSAACNCSSMGVTATSSGITIGTSPWASTVTRPREIGVRYIMYTGA